MTLKEIRNRAVQDIESIYCIIARNVFELDNSGLTRTFLHIEETQI